MSGTTTPRSRRSSTNRSIRSLPWRSSSLANKNLPISSLSIVVAEPEQGAPLKSASESVAPLVPSSESEESARNQSSRSIIPTTSLPPYSPSHTQSSPVSIPAPNHPTESCSSSSQGSPPPFASTVPKTPPSYVPSPQISPTKHISPLPDDLIPLPASISKNTSLESTAALNPTSSKFTISIPLLGRAKVPLESVMEAKKEKEVGQSNGGQTSLSKLVHPIPDHSIAPSSQPILPSTSPLTTLATPTTSAESDLRAVNGAHDSPSTSEADITSESMPLNTTTMTTSDLAGTITDQPRSDKFNASWWTYVGWTSTLASTATATTTSTLTPPTNDVAIALAEVSVANEIPELNPTTPSTAIGATSSLSGGNIVDGSSPESGMLKAIEDTKPAEAVKEVNGPQSASTWYTPWGWYSSTSVVRPEQDQSDGLGVKTSSEHDVALPLPLPLPLAQDPEREPIPTASETPEAGNTPLVPSYLPVNPIATSIEANWSGWASFFSSNALMAKRLGYTGGGSLENAKRDEDGMEVMDIGDDDDEQKGVEETDMLKDSGRRGQVVSPQPVTPTSIAKTGLLLFKTSDSRDSEILRTELRISDNTGDQATPAKSSISSTPKKGNSGSNTPVPIPLPPSPSPSSRGGNQSQSLSSTPPTSTSTKKVNSKAASPAPSKKSISSPPPPPNLVLPTWEHTFNTAPRNAIPVTVKPLDRQVTGGKLLEKTMKFMSGVLFAKDTDNGSLGSDKMKGKNREINRDDSELMKKWETERFKKFGKELPKAWQIEEAGLNSDARPTSTPIFGFCSPESKKGGTIKGSPTGVGASDVDEDSGPTEGSQMKDVLRGCKRVVVIGIHGWFPGTMIRTVVGEPTGTSTKFTNMTEQALQQFEDEHGVKFEKVTKIPLEGDGTIDKRVERLYNSLLANQDWMSDLHEADAIIFATHSQGSIVSTHLLNRLIQDSHITTARNQHLTTTSSFGTGAETFPSAIGMVETISSRGVKVQRICCLALCGIHLGPLRYLSSSTLVQPYIHYFESIAARELFEFQNTESAVSKAYVKALQNVLDHGIKMLYIASLNDQVVPIYSGLFTAVSHPLILRALYIDGDAYHSSDFLSNLLILLIRILNSGISDSGLIAHLSEATAGSLIGVGHSTAYEEITTFSLAVKYLFLSNDGMTESTELCVEPFNANQEQNDYEIPWSLRDIIADERVSHFFSHNIAELRDAFREWHPKTSILRDLKRKLQPITRLSSSSTTTTFNSSGSGRSKL